MLPYQIDPFYPNQHFTALSISNQGPREAEEIVLDLPHLTSLDFGHTHVRDGSGFAASLSACPKLRQFNSYKLWGIGDHHRRLHLPECYSLNLYRSDDLEWLEVHAPKLRSLNLQACYSCEHVCLFPKEGPEVSVNYVNANIGTKSLKHLAQHPHVGTENMHGSNDDDDDIGGMLGDYRPPNMAGMNMAGMTGGAMAELFGNMMGNPGVGPGMGGDYPGDSDEEEDDDESEGAAPDVQDAYLIQLFAMMQQAGSIPPGHGSYGAADEEDEEEEDDEEEEEEVEDGEDSEGSAEASEANEEEQQ